MFYNRTQLGIRGANSQLYKNITKILQKQENCNKLGSELKIYKVERDDRRISGFQFLIL